MTTRLFIEQTETHMTLNMAYNKRASQCYCVAIFIQGLIHKHAILWHFHLLLLGHTSNPANTVNMLNRSKLGYSIAFSLHIETAKFVIDY
jgi:hypothetical protein